MFFQQTEMDCGMLTHESIKPASFVDCTPYAHDHLLGGVRAGVLKPTADFDFASLGF